jgi:hypothetical protein
MEVSGQLHILATLKIGSKVLTATVIKHSMFWDVMLCSPWSQPTCHACGLLHACFLHGLFFNHGSGCHKFLQNVG